MSVVLPITLKKLMTPGLHFVGGWRFLVEVKGRVLDFEVVKGGLFRHPLPRSLTGRPGAYIILNGRTGSAYVGSSGNMASRIIQHRTKLERFEHPNKYLRRDYYPQYQISYDVIYFFCKTRSTAFELEQWLVDELFHLDQLCNVNLDVVRGRKYREVPAFHKPEKQQLHYLDLRQNPLGKHGGFHDSV